ncbi:ABC transporter [Granulicatella adiacens ATCC 49175]|jgi:hypothetical protein|uniref:Uncharacterized protein n=1 Tax=Granulicatella adiacens ATCC 49175 TaxID=638301 RepID=C8NGG6_9LACT|nr:MULTISPECIES: hypothetical protein [Granulicatella]MBF1211122.1 ABC transporter [Granulicatella sp.]EEW37224.1 hypothetical protein HMPREF0444_1011 [Granulicatella adiacens ATCC 49175]MCT2160089.1 ABC transporter [Granulicatella adiacens]OFT01437.1 ABC transporter [Granulicatella sp. HMSC31F03]UAK94105.1 ABC transporter [Granulicatella adiacens]
MSEGVINAIDHLLEIINQYQIEDVNPQIKTLMNLKGFLDANGILDEREKLDVYKSLFPPHGGLSDIYYWDDDFETRKEVNDSIESALKIIANYLLDR